MRGSVLVAMAVASWVAACREAATPTEAFAPYVIGVSIAPGEGWGGIVSDPPGIRCGNVQGTASASCEAYFPSGTSVILKARPDSASAFVSWTEGRSVVTTDSSLTLNTSWNRQLTATFAARYPRQYLYTVRGVAVDSLSGAAVVGATVTIGARSARSDTLGTYLIDSLSAGTYEVRVVASAKYRPFQAQIALCCRDTSRTLNPRLVRRAPWLLSLSMDTIPRWGFPKGQTRVTWAVGEGEFSNGWLDWTDTQGHLGSAASYQYETLGPGTRTYLYHAITDATKITARMANMAGFQASFTCMPSWICKED